MRLWFISGIRRRFQRLSQSPGQVAHVLLTRSPLIHQASLASPFDLHVLSTPPAFILSQDQTLHKKMMHDPPPEKGEKKPHEFNLTKRMPSLTIQLISKKSHQPTQRLIARFIGI